MAASFGLLGDVCLYSVCPRNLYFLLLTCSIVMHEFQVEGFLNLNDVLKTSEA